VTATEAIGELFPVSRLKNTAIVARCDLAPADYCGIERAKDLFLPVHALPFFACKYTQSYLGDSARRNLISTVRASIFDLTPDKPILECF